MLATATAPANGLAMKVGPCMKQPAPLREIVSATSVVAKVAAGERLAQAENVRGDARVFTGEQPAGAAKAGGDLVGDQQHVVRGTQGAHGMIEPHAACALPDGLQDHRRKFFPMRLDQACKPGDRQAPGA